MSAARELITVHDVMRVTKLSRSSSYELMSQLGALNLGRARRLPKHRLDTYLRQLEASTWTSTAESSPAAIESGTSKPTTGKTATASAPVEALECETMEPSSPEEAPKSSAVISS